MVTGRVSEEIKNHGDMNAHLCQGNCTPSSFTTDAFCSFSASSGKLPLDPVVPQVTFISVRG